MISACAGSFFMIAGNQKACAGYNQSFIVKGALSVQYQVKKPSNDYSVNGKSQ
jgi:hypothetical protein